MFFFFAYLVFLWYNPQPYSHGLCNHFMSESENVRLIKSFAQNVRLSFSVWTGDGHNAHWTYKRVRSFSTRNITESHKNSYKNHATHAPLMII